MGTSKSYAGPRSKPALLPTWSVSTATAPTVSTLLPSLGLPDVGVSSKIEASPEVSQTSPAMRAQEQSRLSSAGAYIHEPSPPSGMWTGARRSISRVASSGGGRTAIGKAARSYVRALGGKRAAAKSSSAGVRSTLALGGFLTSVASNGLPEALRQQGLENLIGKPTEEVFVGLCDLLAPAGGSLQDSVARESVLEALEQLYDKLILDGDDLNAVEKFSASDIKQATEAAITAYIYHRWLLQLGIKIEQRAITADRAIKLERDMKLYIREAVALDFKDVNVLQLDWQSGEGSRVIENLFEEAYGVLEEE
jgi:hypothetical protein